MFNKKASQEILFYLLILTSFFLLLELSLFIQNYRDFLTECSSLSSGLHLPLAIFPQIGLFIFIQLLLHFLYCLVILVISLSVLGWVQKFFPISSKNNLILFLPVGIWLVGTFTILLANMVYYPNSKFSELFSFFLSDSLAKNVLLFFLITDGALLILLGVYWFLNKPWIALLLCSSITLNFIYNEINNKVENKTLVVNRALPNIFVIGIDALRPDFLGFFGRDAKTPFIDSFLNEAVVFNQAMTPEARTFPSWTSVLTGRYPKEVGIRTNLARQQFADLTYSLPTILRNRGYDTWFATDETRFSNIESNFGFNRMITPSVGLSDFLFGTINDFPISNLLVNSPLGKWLFPYSYGNRAAYVTYQPESFLNLLRPLLSEERKAPLFLAIHFCLPHYPYVWASLAEQRGTIPEHYQKSIEQVDQQLRSFFLMLKQYGLLQEALVVLLSDHGETLEFSGDRITEKELFLGRSDSNNVPHFYPESDHETVNQTAGHGTDVLGLPQYHTLLAFKLYGKKSPPKIITHLVSLVDIKPTILNLIGIQDIASSGQSLANFINGKHEDLTGVPAKCGNSLNISMLRKSKAFACTKRGESRFSPLGTPHRVKLAGTAEDLKHRPIFLESDFSPPAIRTVFPNVHQVLLEGINIFEIDSKTLRLIVKDDMNKNIIKSKQYAVIEEEWMLALYPQNAEYRMPILINLKTGLWTNDLKSPFAKSSPATRLLKSLKAFYGEE